MIINSIKALIELTEDSYDKVTSINTFYEYIGSEELYKKIFNLRNLISLSISVDINLAFKYINNLALLQKLIHFDDGYFVFKLGKTLYSDYFHFYANSITLTLKNSDISHDEVHKIIRDGHEITSMNVHIRMNTNDWTFFNDLPSSLTNLQIDMVYIQRPVILLNLPMNLKKLTIVYNPRTNKNMITMSNIKLPFGCEIDYVEYL
ncbi:MAG: hypothetical protein Gaeavirus18_3 [Gaeavirus sp.]|uniref:Uncharacterized protein n=1 Tax=Gaeavirus sp. TaxID=2487767 RepID=A0A3G4ZZ47_9VIRU|nr:MAG: hypothetical protein Gaeavirus18_3 [Gaeavirus sp.]